MKPAGLENIEYTPRPTTVAIAPKGHTLCHNNQSPPPRTPGNEKHLLNCRHAMVWVPEYRKCFCHPYRYVIKNCRLGKKTFQNRTFLYALLWTRRFSTISLELAYIYELGRALTINVCLKDRTNNCNPVFKWSQKLLLSNPSPDF